MPVPNSDGAPVTDLFGAGIPLSTGAPGSQGQRAPAPSVTSRTSALPVGQASTGGASGDAQWQAQYLSGNGFVASAGSYNDTGAGKGSGSQPHPDSEFGDGRD